MSQIDSAIEAKIRALAIVSDENRLRILVAILYNKIPSDNPSGRSFTGLCEFLSIDKANLAHHLGILQDAGYVTKNEMEIPDSSRHAVYDLTKSATAALSMIDVTEDLIKKYNK